MGKKGFGIYDRQIESEIWVYDRRLGKSGLRATLKRLT